MEVKIVYNSFYSDCEDNVLNFLTTLATRLARYDVYALKTSEPVEVYRQEGTIHQYSCITSTYDETDPNTIIYLHDNIEMVLNMRGPGYGVRMVKIMYEFGCELIIRGVGSFPFSYNTTDKYFGGTNAPITVRATMTENGGEEYSDHMMERLSTVIEQIDDIEIDDVSPEPPTYRTIDIVLHQKLDDITRLRTIEQTFEVIKRINNTLMPIFMEEELCMNISVMCNGLACANTKFYFCDTIERTTGLMTTHLGAHNPPYTILDECTATI